MADQAIMPGGRRGAASWTDGSGALWLFGGLGYPALGISDRLNDLWKYDVGGGISLDTHALVFSATYGASPAAQMIGLTNVGVTAFTYTNVITYSVGASGWLTVLPSADAVALNGATILTNQVNITGLGAGTYYATNQVTADATNSPQTVVVTLTVIGAGKADPAVRSDLSSLRSPSADGRSRPFARHSPDSPKGRDEGGDRQGRPRVTHPENNK